MHIRYQQKKIVTIIAVCIAIVIIISPRIHEKIGSIFFGGVSELYNINLAQFFLTYASYPPFGKPAPYAHHQLSRTYFIQGHLTEALDEAYKEMEEYPEHWKTYYIIGLTLGFLDRKEEAIDAFGKFIEHHPQSWAARNDRAWLQFRIGDIDGALETIEPVTPNIANPWVQNTYGTLLYNKEQFEKAKTAFEYAKRSVYSMSEEQWGVAYPGNDPRIYDTGIQAMRTSIDNNLKMVEEVLQKSNLE